MGKFKEPHQPQPGGAEPASSPRRGEKASESSPLPEPTIAPIRWDGVPALKGESGPGWIELLEPTD